jgi:ubiquinone/menaquinone biosynthesis C-methylase UbiE
MSAQRVSERHCRPATDLPDDLARLLAGLALTPGLSALDLATGTGSVALELAARGLKVTAVDRAPAVLATARQRAAARQVEVTWLVGSVYRLPFADATFDRVTCRQAAHHLGRLKPALVEWARVLKPGGLLAVSDTTALPQARSAVSALDRLREQHPVRIRSVDQWLGAIGAARLGLESLTLSVDPMPLAEWLSPADLQTHSGRAALEAIRAWPDELTETLCPDGVFQRLRLVVVCRKH